MHVRPGDHRASSPRRAAWPHILGLWALLGILVLNIVPSPVSAQVASNFNQRDDKYRLLGLKRAKEVYETAKRDMDRRQELFQEGLLSEAELDRARSTYAEAEVNYQQSLLAVIFEAQYVSVIGAVKFQGADGSKRVRLEIANTSGGGEEYQKLLGVEEALFRSLQPDLINSVYVSVQNADGADHRDPLRGEDRAAPLRRTPEPSSFSSFRTSTRSPRASSTATAPRAP